VYDDIDFVARGYDADLVVCDVETELPVDDQEYEICQSWVSGYWER
jgi:hypothetical protein